jgi:hypothetical protein
VTDLDRLKLLVRRFLAVLFVRLDYAKRYPATVVAQNADGSLELRSDVPALTSISKVPIRYGVPGITAKVANGGKVLVGFEDASGKLPYALVYDQASVTSIALLGGTQEVARLGDGCSILLPPTSIFTGTVTTGAGTAPFVGPVVMANPFPGVIDSGQLGALA